jgi:putative nucleotidyltransferase with HDIG domain
MMAEARDSYTAGHQKRVAALSVAIGKKMGMTTDQIEGLELAAKIHDIGKIKIPAEILIKPGALNALEFMLIQMHPESGYEMIKNIEFPWKIADMILQHHEKLDGSGYPHGLKGDEILLEARILTVADIVEAVSNHRPYRAALGVEVAMEIITQERGTKLDSDVVDACVALFKHGEFCFE